MRFSEITLYSFFILKSEDGEIINAGSIYQKVPTNRDNENSIWIHDKVEHRSHVEPGHFCCISNRVECVKVSPNFPEKPKKVVKRVTQEEMI